MKTNNIARTLCLLVLVVSLLPVGGAGALENNAPPPVGMFQLPWDLGSAWYAIDGIDNGSKRPATSSHNYKLGGGIDFAPKVTMVTGENTSNYWVTAAAAGTVIATSNCYVTLAHAGGWVTQYQFLGNIQVKLGDVVARNQRLAVIADGMRQKYCPGYEEINVPHLHFTLRPSILGASLAGWEVKYNSLFNLTSFAKGTTSVGLYKPLINVLDLTPTPTPTVPVTNTPDGTLSATPTPVMSPTPTLTGPYVSTSIDPRSIDVGGTALVTVRLNNVPPAGYTSAEFQCNYNANLFEVSNITVASLFGADAPAVVNGPGAQSFIVAVAGSNGNKATTSGTAFTFNVKGTQVGQTVIECRARVSQGNNLLTELPYAVDYLTILGTIPTPNTTPSQTPTATLPPMQNTPTPTLPSGPGNTPTPTVTPITPSATPAGWLTHTNAFYGFSFQYPSQGQYTGTQTNNYARINLPFAQGTNLTGKYVEATVIENAATCRSPLATSSILETSETVVINGLTFLKETGQDGTAGHTNKWVGYSTARSNVCVSLDFVLRAANPGVFSTPPPLYDHGAESAVFGQMVATYTWLTLPTATPVGGATATFTPTPSSSATATITSTPSGGNGIIAGQVVASKPVTINVYDTNAVLVATVETSDGKFQFQVPPGNYTVVAVAPGFLRAQRTFTLNAGITNTLPTLPLLAGDIDNNNVIDQFDAMSIGMSYNSSAPAAADLNNDGTINVLDLELLAKNYRKTGPVAW